MQHAPIKVRSMYTLRSARTPTDDLTENSALSKANVCRMIRRRAPTAGMSAGAWLQRRSVSQPTDSTDRTLRKSGQHWTPVHNGRLAGLHRPFSPMPSESFQAEQARVNAYSAKIRQYLTEMNIGPDFYEAMVRVLPEDIRWVNAKELADLGMPEWDPVYSEYRAGKTASELGISREELNRRLKLRETQCDPLDGGIGPQYCNCVVRIGLYPAGTTCDAAGFPDRPKK